MRFAHLQQIQQQKLSSWLGGNKRAAQRQAAAVLFAFEITCECGNLMLSTQPRGKLAGHSRSADTRSRPIRRLIAVLNFGTDGALYALDPRKRLYDRQQWSGHPDRQHRRSVLARS